MGTGTGRAAVVGRRRRVEVGRRTRSERMGCIGRGRRWRRIRWRSWGSRLVGRERWVEEKDRTGVVESSEDGWIEEKELVAWFWGW